jgi:hypothetical protein
MRANEFTNKQRVAENNAGNHALKDEVGRLLMHAGDMARSRDEMISKARPAAERVAHQMGIDPNGQHFKEVWMDSVAVYDNIDFAPMFEEQFCEDCGGSLAESGKASRALCKSSRSNADLGVSQLASCKSQGLRARETGKKHTIGNKRVKIKGKSVKGHKYGGPLPYNKSDS